MRPRTVRSAIVPVLAAVSLLACGCGGDGGESAQATTTTTTLAPGQVDCLAGAREITALRPTFDQLTERVQGISAAAGRNDLADIKQRTEDGVRLAGEIVAGVDRSVEGMQPSVARDAFVSVSAAAGQVRDALQGLEGALANPGQADQVSRALNESFDGLNRSMVVMTVACPIAFGSQIRTVEATPSGSATPAPTTTGR
ncbi:hypothetical protein [Nocardia huaxiensis]|uniref:Lipoprotein n=1 Tax=Nocardia huaxiensis TaxID=2755382 RepID=A0A7D6Z8E7_9NOCA|nr:hypothetical protein [Nocardia huaxiensis]QLY29528.1 hypothetical protein H0264_30395 [Nocardia huaxiensis]UFS96914.1 hypothetical protein LPY97_02990 [Nocardia huaxiensis]